LWKDCSWFASCPKSDLDTSVPGFRTFAYAAVRGTNASALAAMRPKFSPISWLPPGWRPRALPEKLKAVLRRGVAHQGQTERLATLLRAAAAGRPVVVAGLGASITSDFGGAFGGHQRRFALAYHGNLGACTRRQEFVDDENYACWGEFEPLEGQAFAPAKRLRTPCDLR